MMSALSVRICGRSRFLDTRLKYIHGIADNGNLTEDIIIDVWQAKNHRMSDIDLSRSYLSAIIS